MHVSRGPGGRHLDEIALLRRDQTGCCYAMPVWQSARGTAQDGAEAFRRLIAGRLDR